MKQKPTPQPAVEELDRDTELPEGWACASLGECVDILDHLRIPVNSDERAKRQGKIPYYGATGQVGWINDHLFDEELVLLGEDGAPFLDKDKPIAYLISGKSWVNNHAHVLRAIADLTSNAYIKNVLDAHDFSTEVTGSTRLKLTQAAMRAISVPLSPAPEQMRMMSSVQKLLAQLGKCRTRLTKVPKILKAFRQSVLAAACSGRLTEDSSNDNSWREQSLTDVADIKTGPFGSALHRSDYVSGGVPVINPVNIVNGTIVPSAEITVDPPTYQRLQDYALQDGDIIIARRGEMGRCATVGSRELGWLCGTGSAIIRPKGAVVPRFLQLLISSPPVRAYLSDASVGSTMENLNQRVFKALPLSLPNVTEQHKIVRRVEALFKLADAIEKRVEAATKRADKLTQSILAKAFRGELVPTEAELARKESRTYEPASALLARIRFAREKSAKP